MFVSTNASPVNSLVFIHGPGHWMSPLPVEGKLIWSTSSCVSTACFPECDGPTRLVLGDAQDVDPGTARVFEGLLETPERMIVVTAVGDDHPILSFDVPGLVTRIAIWHSHPRWPEIVTIGVS